MQAGTILLQVHGVPTGTRLAATFRSQDPAGVTQLLREHHWGNLKIDSPDHLYAQAVACSGEWGRPDDRTIHATTTDMFDPDVFAHRLEGRLEALTVEEPSLSDYLVFISLDGGQAKCFKHNGRQARLIAEGSDTTKLFIEYCPTKSQAKALVARINSSLCWAVGVIEDEFVVIPVYDSCSTPSGFLEIETYATCSAARASISN